MNERRKLLLGGALAALGIGLQLTYLHRFEAEASGGPKVRVLAAARTIERGTKITAEMLAERAVPQAYVDERAIRASERDSILDLRAVSTVPVQQTLVWTDLIATNDDRRDLSSLVQPGNRALPIRVQLDEALALIRPGDFVDVLSVDGDARQSSVLLQRVLVLAIGNETSAGKSEQESSGYRASLLTLSVSLQEAQLLSLAQSVGGLTVVVRGASDPRVFEAPPDIDRSALHDSVARQAVQRPSRRPVLLAGSQP
jgi:pilus assembly protein CpaB